MTTSVSNHRPAIKVALLTTAVMLGITGAFPASTVAAQILPSITLTYSDLSLATAQGRLALVERVEATASDHCARYGPLIMPRERLGQTRYCVYAVRGELMRAMPRAVRAAYDSGRRETTTSRLFASR